MKNRNDCVAFHGHACGGLTIGYKASLYAIALPEKARMFDSYVCACCGEVTGANRIRMSEGKTLCLDCYDNYDRFQL